jgi:hypothetical protein
VGYFYPYLKENYGFSDFVNVGKNVFYRGVEVFINRIYDVAADKDDVLMV